MAKTRLGWLDAPRFGKEHLEELKTFAKEAQQRFRHCVLLGMGGSSLAPDVLARVFGKREGGLDLRVLDSTAPDSVRKVMTGFDPKKTLFVVSSKSGTTTEVDAFYRYFRSRIDDGKQYIAITDPGTPLAKRAEEEGFLRTFVNPPDIGGRYSALSFFGLVPAALLGLDVGKAVAEAERVALESYVQVPLKENVAVRLGSIAAGLARAGADKLTFLFSDNLMPFGAWLEQLVAESTGKRGRGIVPVQGEPHGKKEAYGNDRFFVSLGLASEAHDMSYLARGGASPGAMEARRARRAVRRVPALGDRHRGHGGGAGDRSLRRAQRLREQGQDARPDRGRAAAARGAGAALAGACALCLGRARAVAAQGGGRAGASAASSVPGWIAAHLSLANPSDYISLQVYMPQDPEVEKNLNTVQGGIRNATRLACTLGFGPRFLHSTGQLHKGGANNGVFLQITSSGGEDLPIPGLPYSFSGRSSPRRRGAIWRCLQAHGRRALRVHSEDGDAGKVVQTLQAAIKLLAHG